MMRITDGGCEEVEDRDLRAGRAADSEDDRSRLAKRQRFEPTRICLESKFPPAQLKTDGSRRRIGKNMAHDVFVSHSVST